MSVVQDAKHCWRFNKARSLYGIADKVTGKRGIIREGGAKLTKIGQLTGNKFLTLEGLGSSIELGRFESCISGLSGCGRGFTLSLWLRFRDAVGKAQYILGNTLPDSMDKGIVMMRTKDREMQISYKNTTHNLYAKYAASADEWVHHLITWNGQRIAVYKNGKKQVKKRQRRSLQSEDTYVETRQRRSLQSEDTHVETRQRRNIESEDTYVETRQRRSLQSEDTHVETRHRPAVRRQKRSLTNHVLSLGRHGFKIDADYDDVIVWKRILNETEAAAMYYGDLGKTLAKDCLNHYVGFVCLVLASCSDVNSESPHLRIYIYIRSI